MRRHCAAGALLAMTTILFVSCYWQPDISGSGSVRFEIEAVSSNDVSTLDITENAARIFLVAGTGSDQRFFPLGGRGVPDRWVSFSSGRAIVEIENVPDGAVYRLFVAAGQAFPRTGAFHVSRYGSSAPFKVAAGSEVSVGVTLGNAPQVAWALPGAAVSSLVWPSGNELPRPLYAGGGSRVAGIAWTGTGFDSAIQYSFGDVAVNGIATAHYGSSPLAVSTSNGLAYGSIRGGFDVETERGRPRSTLSAVTVASDTTDILMYSRPDGFGGRRADIGEGPGEWFWIDTSRDVKRPPILDMATTGVDYLFIATRLGAVRIPADSVQSSWTSWTALVRTRNVVSFAGAVPVPILSVEVAGDQETSTLFLGTQDGIWWFDGAMASDWNPTSRTVQEVAGSRGRAIHHMAVSSTRGGLRLAAITPFELFIVDIDGPVASTISFPFIAAYPGTPSDLVWLSATHLAISGSEGIVVLNVPE